MPDGDRASRLDKLREESQLGGGEARIARQHEKGKLTARERLDLLLDPGSFEELGTFVRHRSSDFGLENNRPLGDGVANRIRDRRRASRLCLQPGFHSVRWLAFGNECRKNCPRHEAGDGEWGPDHRVKRLWRRANPGRCRIARRLCRHLPF